MVFRVQYECSEPTHAKHLLTVVGIDVLSQLTQRPSATNAKCDLYQQPNAIYTSNKRAEGGRSYTPKLTLFDVQVNHTSD